MTTTKKILAVSAAIAFAATLSSCELKKWEQKNQSKNTEIKSELPKDVPTEIQKDIPAEIPEEATENTSDNTPAQEQDPKMKLFEEKQAEMWKLFQDFEKNTPEFKKLQIEINTIFSSWKQPSEEDMKKVEEIDWKIRALFTPEMKKLDEELRKMWNEIFWQPEINQAQSENVESNVPPIEENNTTENTKN